MSDHEGRVYVDLSLEEKVERLRTALGILTTWLVQAQTGFGERDAQGVENYVVYGDTKGPA